MKKYRQQLIDFLEKKTGMQLVFLDRTRFRSQEYEAGACNWIAHLRSGDGHSSFEVLGFTPLSEIYKELKQGKIFRPKNVKTVFQAWQFTKQEFIKDVELGLVPKYDLIDTEYLNSNK